MNPELDRARREFLDECDMVVRVPATISLSGISLDYECVTMTIPMYSYIGIRIDNKTLQLDELRVDSKVHFGKGMIDTSSMRPLSEELHRSSEKVYLGLMKPSFLEKIGINHRDTDKIDKIKIKVWDEVPSISHIEDHHDLGFIILIYCLINGIKPEQFNSLKENYKQICIETKKYWLNTSLAKEHSLEWKAITLIREIFTHTLRYCIFLRNGANYMCSLIGALEKGDKSSLDITNLEGIHYKIPEIEIPEGQKQFSSSGEGLFDWHLTFKKGKELGDFMLKYVNNIIQQDMIEVEREVDILNNIHLASVFWEGREEELFGPVIRPYFYNRFPDFELNIGDQSPINHPIDHDWGRKILFRSGILRFYGPESVLSDSLRMIEQSGRGWIHYFSFSKQLGIPEEGIRFLMPEEYKLPIHGDIVPGRTPEEKEIVKKKIEVNFTESEIQVSGQDSQKKDYPWLLVENIILQENIHWLWGFIFLSRWTSSEKLERHPKNQFGNYISKKLKDIKKMGFDIQHRRGGNEWTMNYEGTKSNIKCNLLEARSAYKNAVVKFGQDNIDETIKELELAISLPHYVNVKFINAYNLLTRCILKKDFGGISEDLLSKTECFLKWYKRRLRETIFVVQKIYIKNKILSETEIEEEIKQMDIELKEAESNYEAIRNRIQIPEGDKEFEEIANLVQNLREIIEEKISVEGRIADIIYETKEFIAFKNNKDIKDMINQSMGYLVKFKPDLFDKNAAIDFILLNIIQNGVNFEENNTIFSVKNFFQNKLKTGIENLVWSGKPLKEKLEPELDRIKFSDKGRRITPKHPEIEKDI